MRRILLLVILFFTFKLQAGQLPLTVKDVSLMLRAGFSSNAVMRELSTRHCTEPIDVEKENMLRMAGASDELITALKSGKYLIPPKQAAQAQEKIKDLAKRRAEQVEAARSADTLNQSEITTKRFAAKSSSTGNAIQQEVKGDLVHLQYGDLVRYDDDMLDQKKLIALYFSAHWCAPCRKFTPQLIDYYNRVSPQHPEFEVVFVSWDKSQFGFETYMHETNMPWPAIDYKKLAGKDSIRKYAGEGIPCLVLVDQNGVVVSDSFMGKKFVGPQKVLSDLDAIFAGKMTPQVAALH
jgi:nucleoredoxin